jgi:hypothetical protein
MAIDRITASGLGDGGVTTVDIADGAVTAQKLDSAAVTPAAVSDTANTSTGAFDIPTGTTAQRPGSPSTGYLRFNTTLDSTEIYDGTQWGKVSPLTPTLSSVTGTVFNGIAANVTLAGGNFLTSNLIVSFTPSGGSASTVTVTPSSQTAATVAVPSAIYGQSGGTAISVTVTNSDNKTSNAESFTVSSLPTGGDHVFSQGSARVHIFKNSADFVVPSGVTLSNVEYVVIAGGGGAPGNGGGGGAGGFRSSVVGDQSGFSGSGPSSAESRFSSMTAATYPVVVGAGGTGQANGGNSSLNSITSLGGGYGGATSAYSASSGGSGGGGAGANNMTGAAGTAGQGGGGGGGYPGNAQGYSGGGGGSAGANGVGGTSNGGGLGGVGLVSTIITASNATTHGVGEVSGSDVYFAGGANGRGVGWVPAGVTTSPLGGGGDHSSNGQDYTGGGAGCGTQNNVGGKGVVIVRYVLA